MVTILFGLCALPNLAQAQEQKTQLYVVWDCVVNPSTASEYEAAAKVQIELFTKYNFPYPWSAYATNDFHYYFIIAVDNFGGVDKVYEAMGEVAEKAGEEYQKMMKGFEGTYEYMRMGMYYFRPDLSYSPENPRLSSGEGNFVHWSFYYIKAWKRNEAVELAKKWVAWQKSKNNPDGYNLHIGDLGTDEPVFVVTGAGKSAGDYFTQSEKFGETLGEDGMAELTALWEKTYNLCRKYEEKTGRPCRDLFYTPKKE